MNWRFFVGACILAVGILLKLGAPILPIVLGIGLAAFLTWSTRRRTP